MYLYGASHGLTYQVLLLSVILGRRRRSHSSSDVGGETEIGSFNDGHLTRNFAIWRLVILRFSF